MITHCSIVIMGVSSNYSFLVVSLFALFFHISIPRSSSSTTYLAGVVLSKSFKSLVNSWLH